MIGQPSAHSSYLHKRNKAEIVPSVTVIQTPSEDTAVPSKVEVVTVTAYTPTRRSLPCINLGKRADSSCKSCWRTQYHDCNLLNSKCRPSVECQKCEFYEADSPTSSESSI